MESRLDMLRQMQANEPDDAFIAYALGQEYLKHERYDEAVAAFDRTLAIDPNYLYAYFHKAKALDAAGRHDEAVATAEQGLAVAGDVGDPKAIGELEELLHALR